MRTQYGSGTLFQSQTRCFVCVITQANGNVWAFTDWGAAFTFLNPVTSSTVTAQPIDGVDVSNIAQQIGTQDSNLEIKSLLNDSLGRITKAELISGRFSGASVYVFVVDPVTLTSGQAENCIIVGRYRFSKVTMRDSDYSESLHGIEILLKNQIHRVMGSSCDVFKFGDKRCDPGQTLRSARTFALTVVAQPDLFIIDFDGSALTGASALPDYFAFGDGSWTTANSCQNYDVSFEILKHYVPPITAWSSGGTYPTWGYVTHGGDLYYSTVAANNGNTPGSSSSWTAAPGNPSQITRLVLRTPMMLPIQIGDVADCCFGCDRTLSTCQSVVTSNPSGTNVENFQAFPGLPQPDLTVQVGRQS